MDRSLREMSLVNLLRQTSPESPSAVQLPSFSTLLQDTISSRASPLPDAFISQPDVIDLTAETSPPASPRSSPGNRMPRNLSQEPARKRRRILRESSEPETQESGPSMAQEMLSPAGFVTILDEDEDSDEVEEVDLTTVEDEADLRKAQQQQKEQREAQKQRDRLQKEALARQAPNDNKPMNLASISCIICMDNVTNLTITHCGHLFCHECLIQALQAGERQGEHGKGAKCPVCRKPVSRNTKPTARALPQVIPLEIKVRKRSEKAMGKQKVDGPIHV